MPVIHAPRVSGVTVKWSDSTLQSIDVLYLLGNITNIVHKFEVFAHR